MDYYLERDVYREHKSEIENEAAEKKWDAHFNWDEPNYRFDEEAWSEVVEAKRDEDGIVAQYEIEQERNLDHAMDNKI